MRCKDEIIITIITPLYNSEPFIERLRDSILSQNHLDVIEWILVDDASGESSIQVVKELLSNLPISISLYQLPVNAGSGVPAAFGISKAKGKLLIKIDHDDELLPNAIEQVLNDYGELKEKDNICGMLYRSIDPTSNKILNNGTMIPKGKMFTFSERNNVFKDTSDTFEVYVTDVVRDFWTAEYMSKATLSTPLLYKMSNFKPFVSMGNTGLLKYHRDNPDSQTNNIRVSKKTVYTYAEIFNQFDLKFLLRPIFYIKTAVMLLVFSKLVFNSYLNGIKFIDSLFLRVVFLLLLPAAIIKKNILNPKGVTIMERDKYPIEDLPKTKKII